MTLLLKLREYLCKGLPEEQRIPFQNARSINELLDLAAASFLIDHIDDAPVPIVTTYRISASLSASEEEHEEVSEENILGEIIKMNNLRALAQAQSRHVEESAAGIAPTATNILREADCVVIINEGMIESPDFEIFSQIEAYMSGVSISEIFELGNFSGITATSPDSPGVFFRVYVMEGIMLVDEESQDALGGQLSVPDNFASHYFDIFQS